MRLFIHIILLVLVLQGRSEGDNIIGNAASKAVEEQKLFVKYIDTISEFLYKDVNVALNASMQCQELLSKGLALPDSTYFNYVIQKIYLHHSNLKPIEAFNEISRYEKRLDQMEISPTSRKTFDYLHGYTLMELGQWEAAKERFYIDLKNGLGKKDTSLQFFAQYSLGQIYNHQKEYNIALEYNKKALSLINEDANKSSLVSIQIELAETFANMEKYDASMQVLNQAIQIAEENDLGILASDITIKKGHIYLKRRELPKATEMYNRVVLGNESSKDKEIYNQANALYAQILAAKSEYQEAFDMYMKLIEEVEPNDLEAKKDLVWEAQELAQKKGDYRSAYRLFTDYNNITNEIDSNKQSIQTQYYKIKFDIAAKERENASLSANLKSKDHESKQLYLWLALSTLFLLGLVAAFHQRHSYSKQLESKVEERTAELKDSIKLLDMANSELTDFNRILSHDLKEPLRGMIGFSQLLLKELDDKSAKSHDYLNHIVRSGHQLDQLIDSVNLYHKAKICDAKAKDTFNVKDKMNVVLSSVNGEHPEKEIDLVTNADCQISFCGDSFESIFHILFDNALRYNGRKNVMIDVHHQQTPEFHEFEVSDNGIGIPTAHRDKVFAKFQRANSSLYNKGAGMGLSIASKLLEKIGGSISLKDKSKLSGSTFLVKIPV